MIEPIRILGVPVHPLTMAQSVEALEQRMLAGEQNFVVTANAEIIMMCQEDAGYNQIISHEAELVLPDGAGAVWAGRHLGYKAYFFGGSPGIAEAAKTKSEELYPGVQIVGCHNGYFTDADVPAIIEEINNSGAEMLFVALGAPKQEKWILAHRAELKPRILMGIGGSFDVLAGKMERAPKWMQDASLEWAFRLYKQPSRFMRMLALPKFALKVMFSCKK